MKDFFKPEDFELIKADIPGTNFLSPLGACRVANAKLAKEIESWTVVYGKFDEEIGSIVRCNKSEATHIGYLAFMKEIKKECPKHEPSGPGWSSDKPYEHCVCIHCGVEIVPEWKPK